MHCCTQFPSHCSRPLPTHASARDSWTLTGMFGSVSWGWGDCYFLLGPSAHKVLFVPSKSLFPQSCVSSRGVNGNFLQKGFCHSQVCCTQSPCLGSRPLLTATSSGHTQILKGRSGSVSVGYPGMHKVLFELSKNLWQVRDLILNVILPLLPSCLGFSFALWHGVSFFFL